MRVLLNKLLFINDGISSSEGAIQRCKAKRKASWGKYPSKIQRGTFTK